MDMVTVAKEIQRYIKLLDTGREEIKQRAKHKAETIAEYDKVLTTTIIKLRNGVTLEIEGEKISNPPATLVEKIAKGYVWRERLEMETAESEYKNAVMGMSALEAQLNGYQSIFRHLDEGV